MNARIYAKLYIYVRTDKNVLSAAISLTTQIKIKEQRRSYKNSPQFSSHTIFIIY